MRSVCILGAVLTLGCNDVSVRSTNDDPAATILNPADGSSTQEGYAIDFIGTVSDDAPADQLETIWRMGGEVMCDWVEPQEDGTTTCELTLSGVAFADIILQVRDKQGATGSDTVHIIVQPTDAPSVDITSPAADGIYYSDVLVELAGVVSDRQDPVTLLDIGWSVSPEGADLSAVDVAPTTDGEVSGMALLEEGEQLLTLSATDTSGKTGSDTVRIVVGPPNRAPGCAFTAPEDGSSGELGTTVVLEGTATDPDVPHHMLEATFSSNMDGPLDTLVPNSDNTVSLAWTGLSAGTHTLVMSVEDELGLVCSDSILYTVGSPPLVQINAPLDGAAFPFGEPVAFAGTVSDVDQPAESLLLSWSSGVDGAFGAGPAGADGSTWAETDGLSAGSHLITLTATDEAGLTASDSITLLVNSVPSTPGLRIDPAAPITLDDLTAVLDPPASDADGDLVTYDWSWEVDGVASPASDTEVLPSDATSRGERWTVRVVATDGLHTSDPAEASVVIGNALPELDTVTLGPEPAYVGMELRCTAGFATDADGDTLSFRYAWEIDGVRTADLSDRLIAPVVGSHVICFVAPFDGTDLGVEVPSNEVVIEDSPPMVTVVTLTPEEAYEDTVLTCDATGEDADGDPVDIEYTWTVDGVAVGTVGPNLNGADFDKDQTVVCTATAVGGLSMDSAPVLILNTPPVQDTVVLGPDGARAGDTLLCSASAPTDIDPADAGLLTQTYEWAVNDVGVVGSDPEFETVGLPRGTRIVCRVTPHDPVEAGETVSSNELVLENGEPEIAVVTLGPDPVFAGQRMTCTPSGVFDPDGDSVSFRYAWEFDGVRTADVLSELMAPAARTLVQCFVSPWDGMEEGLEIGSNLVVVSDTLPVVTDVRVAPDEAYEESILTCEAIGEDPDGDPVVFSFGWFVNEADIGVADLEIDGTHFDKHDLVVCEATTDGGALRSTEVLILNTPPEQPVPVLGPDPAIAGDMLTCAGGTPTDVDPDDAGRLTQTVEWAVNGVIDPWIGWNFDTTGVGGGARIVCIVTPWDPEEAGEPVPSNEIELGNSPPDLESVTLTPLDPVDGETLTCTPGPFRDPDGDPVELRYAWEVDGIRIAEVGTTLAAPSRGHEVQCFVTPWDGVEAGDEVASNIVEVGNALPVVSDVEIIPDPAYPGDTLTCLYTFFDADGDADNSVIDWYLNGLYVGSGPTWVADGVAGDLVTCEVIPYDGIETGDPMDDTIELQGNCDDLQIGVVGSTSWHVPDFEAMLSEVSGWTAFRIDDCGRANLDTLDVLITHGNPVCSYGDIDGWVSAGGAMVGTPWVVNNGYADDLASLPMNPGNDGPLHWASVYVDILDPTDPILDGVVFRDGDLGGHERANSPKAGIYISAIHESTPGGAAVASWDYGSGRAVYLDFQYNTSDTDVVGRHDWGGQLMKNAIAWAACDSGPPE